MVRAFDLVEAEGRLFKAGATDFAIIIAMLLAVLALGLLGFALALWAIYLALAPAIGPAGAMAVIAFLCLAGAGGAAWGTSRVMRKNTLM